MTNLERMVNCQIKKANNTESYVCCEGWSSLQAVGKNLQRHDMTHKPCNHNGYRVCFVLSFLSFVGLSNKFSNKLLLRLFLQRRND